VEEGEGLIKEMQQRTAKVVPFDNTEMRKRAMPVVEQLPWRTTPPTCWPSSTPSSSLIGPW
jgi:hypothetical protein